jgi:hypothetical protein
MMKRYDSRNRKTADNSSDSALGVDEAPPTRFEFEDWKSYMMRLLRQDGVVYHGSVDHHELARAYYDSGFLLYPTRFSETGCITCIKAMIGGCIPITSRYQQSVLGNLHITVEDAVAGRDALPKLDVGATCASYDYVQNRCVDEAVEPAEAPSEGLTYLHDLGPSLAWDPDFDRLPDEIFARMLEERGILNQLRIRKHALEGAAPEDRAAFSADLISLNEEEAAYTEIVNQLQQQPYYRDLASGASGTRFARWLHTHYLPSVVFASKYMETDRLTRVRNHMMQYSMGLYNWRSSAALLTREVLA